MRSRAAGIVVLLLAISSTSSGQFAWQKPPSRSKKEVGKILVPITRKEPSRDLNIVWVWGIDKLHMKGTHEYAWVMDRCVNVLLPQVPRVTAVRSMYFPKKQLWEKADLVVFYLWPRGKWDYDLIDAYQKRGGGLVFIHMAVMQGAGSSSRSPATIPSRSTIPTFGSFCCGPWPGP